MAGGGVNTQQLSQLLSQQGAGNFNNTANTGAPPAQNFTPPPQYQPQGQAQSGQDQTQIGQTNPSAGPDGGGAPTQGYGDQTAAMQTPLGAGSQPLQIPMLGNKPLNMSQFRPQQGLQVQGNPTSQVVGQGQQNG